MKIPFSPPRMDQKIVDEVVDTLKSGWITTGPKTKEFERELTAYCGNKATLAVNSNTIGLEVVLRWFGVQEGDEVIVPAYTYCATANVIVHCGAKPVMVDVRADDFDISVENVRKALTPRTKVVMPVDLGGMPCDYDAVFALVESEEARAMFSPRTEEQRELTVNFHHVLIAWGIADADIPGVITALRLRLLVFAVPMLTCLITAAWSHSLTSFLALACIAPPCLLGIVTTLWRISVLRNRRFTPLCRWLLRFRKRP